MRAFAGRKGDCPCVIDGAAFRFSCAFDIISDEIAGNVIDFAGGIVNRPGVAVRGVTDKISGNMIYRPGIVINSTAISCIVVNKIPGNIIHRTGIK